MKYQPGEDTTEGGDREGFETDLARAARALSRRDPVLRPYIKQHGLPSFRPHNDYFATLVESIISQQISSRAAESILRRMREGFNGVFDPQLMASVPDEIFRSAGISPQKLLYLRSLAGYIVDGTLDLDELPGLDDQEVIDRLTEIKGIGVWTAQMFLIFSLGRLDVLPVGDLGVKRGMQIAYGLEDLPTPAQVTALAGELSWAPYRSVGSWYMWRVVVP